MPPITFDAYGYAREILLPSLNLAHHPFVIKAAGRKGGASRLARLVVERGPVLLVRIFDGRERARRNVLALRLLENLNLPAPRLELDDTSPANLLLRRRGLPRWATAETWIEGVPAVEAPGKDTEKVALQVASLLARYHAVTRSRWGRLGPRLDPRPFHAYVLSRVRRMFRDLVNRGVAKASTAEAALARYEDWRKTLMKLGTFQLIHRDANRHNFIIPADKKADGVIPIDLHRLAYGAASEDVADALHHFCRSSKSLALRFLDHYLDEARPASRVTWDRTGDFFISLNALKRLHKRTRPEAPDRLRSADARMGQWLGQATTLSSPPRIWPEPGSAPPEREAPAI